MLIARRADGDGGPGQRDVLPERLQRRGQRRGSSSVTTTTTRPTAVALIPCAPSSDIARVEFRRRPPWAGHEQRRVRRQATAPGRRRGWLGWPGHPRSRRRPRRRRSRR
uniref:Uncharacterized protein n=1 Tax=Arundo donax TaxID=35708 RepID=A0A0A9CY33_ARUDO